MKPATQESPNEASASARNLNSTSFRLKMPEGGEISSNAGDQTKIKVDTDVYSHYIE